MFYPIYEATVWLDEFSEEFASDTCNQIYLKRESLAETIFQALTNSFHPVEV